MKGEIESTSLDSARTRFRAEFECSSVEEGDRFRPLFYAVINSLFGLMESAGWNEGGVGDALTDPLAISIERGRVFDSSVEVY